MPPERAFVAEENHVLKAAQFYWRRGWRVVPVEAGGKKPFNPDSPGGRGWQHLMANEDDVYRWFSAAQHNNIGVLLGEPSNGLIDIDLDASQAMALAATMLPPTGAIFGRAGKPRSHWLYIAHTAKTRQFEDTVDGAMLVEIRSAGAQTVFPPSIHTSGQLIEWAAAGDAAAIDADLLARKVATLAAAALLARHWPGEGARHDAQLTLVAFLTRAGWEGERIAQFTSHVVAAAGGEADLAKRRATARDAAQRLADGRTLRGLPSLVDAFGEKIARAVTTWLGVSPASRAAPSSGGGAHELQLGSHVEIARVLIDTLESEHGAVVHTEGEFWVWSETHWRAMTGAAMHRAVHRIDGARFPGAGREPSVLRLTNNVIESILREAAAIVDAPGFFDAPTIGANCASGLVSVNVDGAASLDPHKPAHRRRHVLPGRWSPGATADPAPGSLLHTFLEGTCGADDDGAVLAALLSEVAGVAALGMSTQLMQPKAIVLIGPKANNGKSAFLDMLRALVSPDARAGVSPRRFNDDRQLVQLVGVLLNAADELGGEAIASDIFKQVVTGDVVTARDVYKSAISFRPQALNVFACNDTPHFRYGLDLGLRRRLLPIPFTREIPEGMRIAEIGRRIGAEEGDALLAWAIAGARRVRAQGGFSIPLTCIEALRNWANATDPVAAWLHDPEDVTLAPDSRIPAKIAYAAFKLWAVEAGYTPIPHQGAFTQRVQSASANRVQLARASHGNDFVGIALRRCLPRR